MRLSLLLIGVLLAACGVKAPPIAPEQSPEEKLHVNCSPQDPKCDVQDPNYKSQKK